MDQFDHIIAGAGARAYVEGGGRRFPLNLEAPAAITGAMSLTLRRYPDSEPGRSFVVLDAEHGEVPVRLRVSPRARRIAIRIDPSRDGVELVRPRRVAAAEAWAFLEARLHWVAARLAEMPPRVRFADGAMVPLLGVDHRVVHRPGQRIAVRRGPRTIKVGGPAEQLARRLTGWLKAEARRVIVPKVAARAVSLGSPWSEMPPPVAIGDPRSQWGGCSAKGRLSFSWRLLLAPEPVLDYVVAHEVAHLKERNHGRRFWALTARLAAEVGVVDEARAWLRRNGARLHRYG